MSEIQFPLATTSWDEAEYAAIDRVVKSGMFSMGAEVRKFEEQFAAAMGSAHAVMVNSGSSANLLMIAALRYHSKHGLPEGSEVIVPAGQLVHHLLPAAPIWFGDEIRRY